MNAMNPVILHHLRARTPRAKLDVEVHRELASISRYLTGDPCPVTNPDLDDFLILVITKYWNRIQDHLETIRSHLGECKI
jgi:hypothetical protein